MRDTLRSPSTEKETKTKKGKTRDAPRSPSTLFYSRHRHRFTFFGLQPLPQIKKKKRKIYNHIILATMVFISIPNQTQTPPPFIPSSSPSSNTKPTSPFITSSEFICANPTLYALKTTFSSSLINKGINIKYEIRDNRTGYKAGALKEGMKHSYVKLCDYVVIFDADFQPEPDFLWRTIPFLVHNPDNALVQTRWKFGLGGYLPNKRRRCDGTLFDVIAVNADECLMTRMQEMSLDYHFTVEQEVGSVTYTFFGFNGTAGVWRISALNEAGGWKERTTVEIWIWQSEQA